MISLNIFQIYKNETNQVVTNKTHGSNDVTVLVAQYWSFSS